MAGEASTLTRARLGQHPVWARAIGSRVPAGAVILPRVVSAAVADRAPVEGSPGGSRIERLSVTEVVRDARDAAHRGLAGVHLLGAADRKDELALLASERDHTLVRAIRAVKEALPDFGVSSDVCVCPHTAHGQCVLFAGGGPDLPGTLNRLAEIAVVHADAGVDLIVLSGMVPGSAETVRRALDEAGYRALPLSITLEVESALRPIERAAVGAMPVRERAIQLLPAGSAPVWPGGLRELIGPADAIAVRPAGVAQDLVALLARESSCPVIAYHPADEHALYVAASLGDVDALAVERETVSASLRAGASLVATYGAREFTDD